MKNFLMGFFIAAVLGIGFGYFWAAQSYMKTYEIRLEQKEILVDHYRNHWTPIREVPERARIK